MRPFSLLLTLTLLPACGDADDDKDPVVTTESTALGVELTATLGGDDSGTWTAVHTDLRELVVEGRWWNSSDCANCTAALFTRVGDRILDCTEMPAAGEEPGMTVELSSSFAVAMPAGAREVQAIVVENAPCTEDVPDGGLAVDLGTLTVALDEGMVVETTSETTEVDPRSALVVNMIEAVDLGASPDATVTLTGPEGAVDIEVTYDQRFVRVQPTAPMEEGRNTYLLEISGLVGVSGAVMPGVSTTPFVTALFDPWGQYVLHCAEHGSDIVMAVAQPDYDTPRMEDQLLNYPPNRWLAEPAGDVEGYQLTNAWSGEALVGAARQGVPTMAAADAGNTAHQWRVSPASEGTYRLSTVAHGDGVVLDCGSYSAVSGSSGFSMTDIGFGDRQLWRLQKVDVVEP